MQSFIDFSVGLVFYIQTTFTGLAGFFNAITALGSENFYLLAFPLLYWTVESRLRLRVGIFFGVSVFLNEALKILFHQPRPYWVSTRVQLLSEPESTFGVPSGHAQHAVIFWGTLAAYAKRRVIWTAAIGLMLLVGLSRVYLGVHFPHDTLLGWFVGLALLAYLSRRENALVDWFEKLTTNQQLMTVWLVPLAGILIGLLVMGVTSLTWELPLDWSNNAGIQAPEEPIVPITGTNFITTLASVSGLLIGHVWLSVRGGFDSGGAIGMRIGRFLLGIIGVFLIWAGLDAAFSAIAADETVLGYILRYIRYSAVGLWIGLFAPLIFIRLGLAHQAPLSPASHP